jgi:hypothetical protein
MLKASAIALSIRPLRSARRGMAQRHVRASGSSSRKQSEQQADECAEAAGFAGMREEQCVNAFHV